MCAAVISPRFPSIKKIALSFSKEAKNYNIWATPQKEAAFNLWSFYENKTHAKEKAFLDAGCGTGILSQMLLECSKSFLVRGIDLSASMIDEYSKKACGSIGDMENMPYPDAFFDATLSSFAMHWTDIEKSIKEFVRISKYSFAFALPIKASLPCFNFPFYEEEYILSLVRQYSKNTKAFMGKIDIPFKGFDLIRYFHHTGVARLNPQKPVDRLMKKKALENFIMRYNRLYYIMLYVSVTL